MTAYRMMPESKKPRGKAARLVQAIDAMGVARDATKAAKKVDEASRATIEELLGDDAKRNNVYHGDRYDLVIMTDTQMKLSHEAVLEYVGAAAFEKLKKATEVTTYKLVKKPT